MREHPVTALRIVIIVTVLLAWEALAQSGLLYRDVVPSLQSRSAARSYADCWLDPDCSTSHLYATFYEIVRRHGDRRRRRACGRHRARRLEADAARLRAVPLLSRARARRSSSSRS